MGKILPPVATDQVGMGERRVGEGRTEGSEFGFEGRNLVGREGGTVSTRQRERDGHVLVPVADANRIGLPERHSEPGHEAESPSVPAHAEHDTGKIMARMVTRDLRLGPTTLSITETGEGTPIVFLHAFPLNARMWTPQLEALPAGWRGVAPDLRGFGNRPVPRTPARHVA